MKRILRFSFFSFFTAFSIILLFHTKDTLSTEITRSDKIGVKSIQIQSTSPKDLLNSARKSNKITSAEDINHVLDFLNSLHLQRVTDKKRDLNWVYAIQIHYDNNSSETVIFMKDTFFRNGEIYALPKQSFNTLQELYSSLIQEKKK